MIESDRIRLLDAYKTPGVRIGTVLTCEMRDDEVIVVGYSAARIPWPLGRRRGTSARGLILFGDLIKAVRCESNQAVAYWFGITTRIVTRWRKALGVRAVNEGTRRLKKEYSEEEWFDAARKKASSKANDPERRRKIAEALKGKPRPAHVIEAVRKARTGAKHTAEAKAKMRAARKARGPGHAHNGRAWTEQEDLLVRTLPAAAVAHATGRTLRAVYSRRGELGVPDGRASKGGKRA